MSNRTKWLASDRAERGGALLISLIVALVVAGLAASAYTLGFSHTREVNSVADDTRALYVAEASISDSLMQVGGALGNSQPVPPTVGTANAPVDHKVGTSWCTVVDNGDSTYTMTATGRVNQTRRTIEVVAARNAAGVFDYAIFAGNSSGDPAYAVKLGGTGAQADDVGGSVYSGGDIEIDGDATVSGDLEAAGTISGAAGTAGSVQPIPDIAGMKYATNNDFDVAALFATAVWQADDAGGSAWQLPESNPAHFLRKNPSDRVGVTSATSKDDYFIEDPYEPMGGWTDPYGGKTLNISLSGTGGKPGPSGTGKIYYVDGNLWVHSPSMMSVRFVNPDPEGARVTFVVSGNVYFSDNVFLDDPSKSGVAFLAIADPNEPDSGNIYLGDPSYGTLEYMQAFMYAENNFYDNNLSATGSATVTVDGNMTAGNHVSINRDYVKADGSTAHSKLTVNFDDRLSTGQISMPGLPDASAGVAGLRVTSWRELED